MPVYCLEGLPGSGKSLYIISKIIAPLLQAKDLWGNYTPTHIYHNIEGLRNEVLGDLLGVPLAIVNNYLHNYKDFANEDNEYLKEEKDYIRYFYAKPETLKAIYQDRNIKEFECEVRQAGSVFIIDEAQNFFNSRDFKDVYSYNVIKYLSRHRHYNHTIWWCTQSMESVDITFRRQTDTMYFLERMENWGLKNTTKISKFEGWVGRAGGLAPYVKETWKHDKKFFLCYQSYVSGAEQGGERRYWSNVWLNNKGLRVIAIIFVIVIIAGIFGLNNLKTNGLQTMKKANNIKFSPPTTSTGLAPSVGEAVETNEPDDITDVDEICIKQTWKISDKIFLKLSNNKVVNDAENISICDDSLF